MSRIVVAGLLALFSSCAGLASGPASAGVDNPPAEVCGDLLRELEHKPPHLDFLGCRIDAVQGLDAFVAAYRVEGRYAAPVERHFVKAFAMPTLGFFCCGWDSIGKAGRDGWLQHRGATYSIAMGSGETLLNRREDWSRIPWFSVTVTRYLEEP